MKKAFQEKTEADQIRYDAFISYRHTEPDMYAAKTLHKAMEAFRLPKNVKRKLKEGGRTRISRVFRDRDELPLAMNLADPIMNALAVSDYLIVICSPRLPESLWCRKEIRTFIELHGRENIFAVLVEGEPEDSFPEELLYREETITREDGGTEKVRIPVEPLAADIRGKSKRQIRRKIREEVVRLAAPMFGCTYDELKQRHRERKMKRLLAVAAAIAGVCLIFGSVSSAMALKIRRQNREIKIQSVQINEQKEQIEKQYQESLVINADLQAAEALRLLEEGDRVEAVRTAAQILPSGGTDEQPYVPAAEYALSQSLGVYRDGTSIIPEIMLKHDTNVDFMKLSPDGKTLLTVDDTRIIYLWELQTGKLICKMDEYTNHMFMSKDDIIFLDNERLAYLNGEEILILGTDGKEITSFVPEAEKSTMGACLAGDGMTGCFLYLLNEEVQVYSSGTLELLFTLEAEENKHFTATIGFCPEKQLIAVMEAESGASGEILIADIADRTIRGNIPLTYEDVEKLYFKGDTLYILNNSPLENRKNADGTLSALFYEAKGRVTAYDVETGRIKWFYEDPENPLNNISVSQDSGSDVIILTSGDNIIGIHGKDGSFMGKSGVGSTIVKLGVIQGSDRFIAYTRSGQMLAVDGKTDSVNVIEIPGCFVCTSDNVETILNGEDGRVIVQPYSDSRVTVMRAMKGEKYEVFAEGICAGLTDVDGFDGNVLTVDEDLLTIRCLDKEGKEIWSKKMKKPVTDVCFFTEACLKVAVMEENQVTVLDRYTGEQIISYILDEKISELTLEGCYIYAMDREQVRIYETLTGELCQTIELEEIYEYGDVLDVMPYNTYMAIASVKDRMLRIYDTKSLELLGEMEVNAAYIEDLFLRPGNDYAIQESLDMELYINYKNKLLEHYSYQAGEGILFREAYDDRTYQIKELTYAFAGEKSIYRLKCGGVTAEVPGYAGVSRGVYYAGDQYGSILYRVPAYSVDMLLKEAEKYLE